MESPKLSDLSSARLRGSDNFIKDGDQQHWLTYLAIAMVPLVWFLLFRTRHGLEVRCLGEYLKVLDAKGLRVEARQYMAVMFGGCMTGLGGAFLMLACRTGSCRRLPPAAAGSPSSPS